jgi:hypothetical protein
VKFAGCVFLEILAARRDPSGQIVTSLSFKKKLRQPFYGGKKYPEKIKCPK